MAQASQLINGRAVLLGITAIATTYSAYVLYHNLTKQRPEDTALRRSNAVHRTRAQRPRPRLDHRPPQPGAPLGHFVLRRGTSQLEFDLMSVPFPSPDEIATTMGPISDDAYSDLVSEALDTMLHMCLSSQSAQSSEHLGQFRSLLEALATRNQDDIQAAVIVLLLVFPDATEATVTTALLEALNDINATAESADTGPHATDIAETEDLEDLDGVPREPSQGIKGLLYYIAEEEARRKAYEHRNIQCEGCGESPVRGIRWKCLNCPDFDLCSTCEAQSLHTKTHVFAKVKIPIPVFSQANPECPIWYSGDPRKMHGSLDPTVKKRMSQEHGFEEPTIDALYDQFTCLANVRWAADPIKVQAAIDRRAFNRALTSERWPRRFAPNAMYDRMFAFYDTDSNGLIGLEEFMSGLAYLRGPQRFASLRRALQGLDIDDDGFVDRTDFMRLFKAKYVIQQHIVSEVVEGQEAEQTRAAMDVIRSSQPISSVFNQEEIPQGEERRRRGKQSDTLGDMLPLPGTKTILSDDDPWPQEGSLLQRSRVDMSRDAAPHDRLQHHLSRFEEMLYSPVGTDSSSTFQQTTRPTESRPTASAGSPQPPPSECFKLGDSDVDDSGTNADLRLPGGDALWLIVEEGFNDMLDPLFKAKETEHNDAESTKGERLKWRADIESMLGEKRAFQEELQSASLVDPLMATAMKSHTTVGSRKLLDMRQQAQLDQQAVEPPFKGDIVPTDAESLARREADIAQQPLEELLNVTGYSAIEASQQQPSETSDARQSSAPAVAPFQPSASERSLSESGEDRSRHTIADSSGTSLDPMMPQNTPNASQTTQPIEWPEQAVPSSATSTPPSRQRLEYLASLDDIEREIEDRGGAGRLSFDDIESMVQADPTKGLRGLVLAWLEWASF